MSRCTGKQLALLETNSAVRTCGFDFSGNIIMFSTDKQMGYQCYLNFFDLRDPQQIGTYLSMQISENDETSMLIPQDCPATCFKSASFSAEDNQPYLSLPCSEHKITSAVWGPLGDFVIAGHENGEINQFSAKVG